MRPLAPDFRRTLFLLPLLSTVAWAAGHRLASGFPLDAIEQIGSYSVAAFMSALPAALVLAAGGALVLGPVGVRPWPWLLGTVVVLPMAMVLGFLADAVVLYRQVHAMGMALLGEGGDAFMRTSPPLDLLFAGLMLGVAQLPSLPAKYRTRWGLRALWVVGGMAGLGVGWFVSGVVAARPGVPGSVQGGLMGLVSGAAWSGVLFLMDREARGGSADNGVAASGGIGGA